MQDGKYRCYCFSNGVTVGVEGSVKKKEIGCSEVNVMMQEDMMNRSFFMTRKGMQILFHVTSVV